MSSLANWLFSVSSNIVLLFRLSSSKQMGQICFLTFFWPVSYFAGHKLICLKTKGNSSVAKLEREYSHWLRNQKPCKMTENKSSKLNTLYLTSLKVSFCSAFKVLKRRQSFKKKTIKYNVLDLKSASFLYNVQCTWLKCTWLSFFYCLLTGVTTAHV